MGFFYLFKTQTRYQSLIFRFKDFYPSERRANSVSLFKIIMLTKLSSSCSTAILISRQSGISLVLYQADRRQTSISPKSIQDFLCATCSSMLVLCLLVLYNGTGLISDFYLTNYISVSNKITERTLMCIVIT